MKPEAVVSALTDWIRPFRDDERLLVDDRRDMPSQYSDDLRRVSPGALAYTCGRSARHSVSLFRAYVVCTQLVSIGRGPSGHCEETRRMQRSGVYDERWWLNELLRAPLLPASQIRSSAFLHQMPNNIDPFEASVNKIHFVIYARPCALALIGDRHRSR